MKILTAGIDLEAFLRGLSCSDGKLLMLDYDGTLSPYHVERHKAVPYPGIREILDEALQARDCRIVIISGRAISDLAPLLGIKNGIEIWGCHGWEKLAPDGTYSPPDLSDDISRALIEAADWASSRRLGDRLETKPACLALHWRGLDGDDIKAMHEDVREAWGSIASRSGLELHPFNGGLELRPSGMHKGNVVDVLLGESGGPAAYLGDDMTDEDAFEAISGKGLGVLVSDRIRKTAADVWLVPPEDLMWFLGKWVSSCGSVG